MLKITLTYLILFSSFFLTTAQSDYSYTSNDTNVDLVTSNGPISFQTEFDVTQSGIIGIDYNVDNITLSLLYELPGNLIVEVISPQGTVLDLSSLNGSGNVGGFDGTIFEDGGNDITQESFLIDTGITGTFEPEGGTFAQAFSGENILGSWKLTVSTINWAFTYHMGMFYQSTFNFSNLSCPNYLPLNVNNVSDDSANLSWTPANANSITNYEYVIMPDGVTADVNTAVATAQVSTTTSNVNITGISENTHYDAYVRSICGSGQFGDFYGPLSFQTLSIGNYPYLETFQGGIQTPMLLDDPNDQMSISNNCATNYGDYLKINGGSHSLSTPILEISNETDIELSFLIYKSCDDASEAGENLLLTYYDGTTWQNIADIDPANISQSWTTMSYSINSGLTDNFRIKFERTGGSNDFDDINIDNLFIRAANACEIPFNIEASQTYTDSATFQWTWYPDATQGFNWLIMEDGVVPNVSDAVANGTLTVETNSFTSPEVFADGIDYDFYLQSDCGADGTSGYSNVLNFSTPCKTDTPYHQDFEAGFPNCQSVTNPSFVTLESGCGENETQFLSIDGGQGYGTHPMDMSNETSLDVSWRLKKSCFDPTEDGETLKAEYWNGSA